MSVGNELDVVEQWIEEQLAAESTLTALVSTRIYRYRAPDLATYPFVTLTMQSALDYRLVGPDRLWTDTLYVVKGTVKTGDVGASGLAAVAAAIDTAMTLTTTDTVSSPSGTIFQSVREQPFHLTEHTDGNTYHHRGGVYRIYAQGS